MVTQQQITQVAMKQSSVMYAHQSPATSSETGQSPLETSVSTRSLELSDSLRNKLGKPGIFSALFNFLSLATLTDTKGFSCFCCGGGLSGHHANRKSRGSVFGTLKEGKLHGASAFHSEASVVFPS